MNLVSLRDWTCTIGDYPSQLPARPFLRSVCSMLALARISIAPSLLTGVCKTGRKGRGRGRKSVLDKGGGGGGDQNDG